MAHGGQKGRATPHPRRDHRPRPERLLPVVPQADRSCRPIRIPLHSRTVGKAPPARPYRRGAYFLLLPLVGLNPYSIRDSIGVRLIRIPIDPETQHEINPTKRLLGAVLLMRSGVFMGAALTKKTGAVHANNGRSETVSEH